MGWSSVPDLGGKEGMREPRRLIMKVRISSRGSVSLFLLEVADQRKEFLA